MPTAYANLWWLPVGAGGHVVIHTSRWWELFRAHREKRAPRPLFHAALEVFDGNSRYVIEMTPEWGGPTCSRGVVAGGPVGFAWLGVSRFFRYEVRCWKDGIIPDRQCAVEPPMYLPLTAIEARELIDRTAAAPRLVWGRDVFGISDMWNSNSLIAWLLSGTIDMTRISPPKGGSTPGWYCGIVAASG